MARPVTLQTRAAKAWQRFKVWRWRDQAILAVIVTAIAAANFLWASLETRGPHWDMARHLWTSINYLDLARGKHIKGLLEAYYYYPPLVYWAVIPWYLVFGTSIPVAILANVVFLGILAFSIYGIGHALWNRYTGLLATIFILSSPMVVTQFKEFQLDAPLAALVALSIYLLIRSREFSVRRYSILLGASIGAALLIKWTSFFILGLPLAAAVVQAVYLARRKRDWQRVLNMWLTGSVAYAISSLWYLTNQHQLKIDLLSNGVTAGIREGDPAIGSFASNLWYVNDLVNRQLYLVPLVLLVVGLVITFRKRINLKRNLYPLLLIIGSIFFFTLLRNKDSRYTLAILSGVGVLATFWISELPNRWRHWVGAGLMAYAVAAFLLISFGRPRPDVTLFPNSVAALTVFGTHGYIIGAPSGQQWHQQEAFELMAKDTSKAPKTASVSTLDTIWFNAWGVQYYSARYKLSLVDKIETAGFILQRSANVPALFPGFERQKTWALPDGSTLTLDRIILNP